MQRIFTFSFGLILLLAINANSQLQIPELAGHRIHDQAGVLSPGVIDGLERSLKSFEDSTSNQIVVLIVNSLEGEAIDQYGIRLADKWRLGQKDKDNGVIVLISIADKKMRLEVGQGLEGPLPDAISNRIIRNEMAPYFRRGDYDSGVIASLHAIRMAIKGEYTGTGPKSGRRKGGSGLGFILFLLIIFFIFRRGGGNRGAGGHMAAGAAGWYLGSRGGFGGGGGGFGGGFSGGGGGFGGGGSSGSW